MNGLLSPALSCKGGGGERLCVALLRGTGSSGRFRSEVASDPPDGPKQPERAGDEEDPAPRRKMEPVNMEQHGGNHWRGNDRAKAGAAIDDPHRHRAFP